MLTSLSPPQQQQGTVVQVQRAAVGSNALPAVWISSTSELKSVGRTESRRDMLSPSSGNVSWMKSDALSGTISWPVLQLHWNSLEFIGSCVFRVTDSAELRNRSGFLFFRNSPIYPICGVIFCGIFLRNEVSWVWLLGICLDFHYLVRRAAASKLFLNLS